MLEGELISISDGHFVGDGPILGGLHRSYGPTAVLRVAGIEILLVTIAQLILDRQQFKSFGIEPDRKRVVALKSMQHFRAAFEQIAGQVIVCDSGALCTLHYESLPYRNVRRPTFPLDWDAACYRSLPQRHFLSMSLISLPLHTQTQSEALLTFCHGMLLDPVGGATASGSIL